MEDLRLTIKMSVVRSQLSVATGIVLLLAVATDYGLRTRDSLNRQTAIQYPRAISLIFLASFSIFSARSTTFNERTFSLDLSRSA